MRFSNLTQELMLIVLICFVSPCYQLTNDNSIKPDYSNAKASNVNQVLNTKKVIADRRQPIKPFSLHSSQPLIIKRKIVGNTVKPQTLVKSKTPIVKKENTHQEDTVQNQNGKPKIDSEPKSYKKPMFFEDQDIDDIVVPSKNNVGKTKPKSYIKQDTISEEFVSEISEISSKSEDKINGRTLENKENINSDKLEIQNMTSNDSKTVTQSVSAEENISELEPNLKIEANEKSDIKNNIPLNVKLTFSEKKNSSPILDKAANKKDLDISKNNVENKSASRSFKTDDLLITNKQHFNIDPKLMKELSNDSNNKIYIKNCQFEELQETYNPSSKHSIEGQEHDLNNTYENPLRQKQDKFEDSDYITNLNTDLKYDHYRTPNDRIWRKWKNTEIQIKSDDFKDIETGITKESNRDICDCYSNNDSNPIDYTPYNFETDYENVYPKFIQKERPKSYYLPTYTSYPSCYQPKSYGYQYAPMTRYQNYLFPCLY